MTSKTRKAPPRAMAMLESLRGLGYSTAAALADIVDNSISAGASEIRIDFQWDGPDSRLLILDDGRGMSDPELEGAMRLGDKNPLAERDAHDLGRFGMGLKTASLSQCRRLTVASAKGGKLSCLRWDLDELAADPQSDWLLFEGPAEGSDGHLISLEGKEAGTLVLWEKLDRIVTAGYTADNFGDLIDTVQSHLAMVFHRLIQGPRARIRLLINNRPIEPWDPFMTGHPAKPWSSPLAQQRTDSGLVFAQCHVLPHRDKLSAEEFEENAFMKAMERVFPATNQFHGTKSFIKENGKRLATPMFFVILALGTTDLLFALDSIPAIYGLTREPYIVLVANLFALMGLRQLYFLLGGLLQKLVYLSIGLSVLLAFIGVKLLLHALHENELPFINGGEHVNVPEIPIAVSLGAIVVILGVTTIASLWKSKRDAKAMVAGSDSTTD